MQKFIFSIFILSILVFPKLSFSQEETEMPQSIPAEHVPMAASGVDIEEEILATNETFLDTLIRLCRPHREEFVDRHFRADMQANLNSQLQLWNSILETCNNLPNSCPRMLSPTQFSINQRQAMLAYTGACYSNINAILRRGAPYSEDERLVIHAINSALRQIPVYSGIVRRFAGFNNFPAILAEHLPTSENPHPIVRYTAYTSSSIYGTPYTDVGFSDTEFLIHARPGGNARAIMNLSENSGEAEVMFLPGTCFRVDSVMRNQSGHQYIVMTEVRCPQEGRH